MPAVRPLPSHRIASPAPIPSPAKSSPWGEDRRPEGNGRPAVRAISASCARSCTWFSAEAPHDRSMTPASISTPSRHGKPAPRGAVNMKPAAAETSTSSTMPSLDNSAYTPMRENTATLPVPRSTVATLGKACPCHGPGGPARNGQEIHGPRPRRRPHERSPQGISDSGVGGADRRVESQQDGGDAERHLHHGEQRGPGGQSGERSAPAGQRHVAEEP